MARGDFLVGWKILESSNFADRLDRLSCSNGKEKIPPSKMLGCCFQSPRIAAVTRITTFYCKSLGFLSPNLWPFCGVNYDHLVQIFMEKRSFCFDKTEPPHTLIARRKPFDHGDWSQCGWLWEEIYGGSETAHFSSSMFSALSSQIANDERRQSKNLTSCWMRVDVFVTSIPTSNKSDHEMSITTP